jgi:hypothetical protein
MNTPAWKNGAVVALIAGAAVFALTQESPLRPPFHAGPAFLLEPAPAFVPSGPAEPDGPMSLLARPKNYSAARASSFARGGGNRDTIDLPPGGGEVTLADLQGPGAITHIWMTFRGGGRDILLRFYWEGSAHPSVEAPIGDFFGAAVGIDAVVDSFPIQVSAEGRARNCWWYMPFNRAARVTASNIVPPDAAEARPIQLYYYIDYRRGGKADPEIPHFHARFIETDPAPRGRMITLADIKGRGHFVGVVLGQRARTQGWFGEGDDVITVDGRLSFAGTGTEDYFCDAWGFRPFSDLYHGVPVYEGRRIGDRLSAYRFHIADPIPFRRTFKFEIEHWPWFSPWPNTGRDYYSSLSFWYQTGLHEPWPRLEKLLSADPWDPTKGRWHIPGALEAEDLGLLGFRSRAVEQRQAAAEIGPLTESRDVLRSLLHYGPRPEPVFLMPNLSGDRFLGFDSGGDGEFSLAVPADSAGTYAVKLYLLRAEDYAIVEFRVNGKTIGEPIDTYLSRAEGMTRPVLPPKEFVLSDVPLRAGANTFEFVIESKNPESKGSRMGLDAIALEKTAGQR